MTLYRRVWWSVVGIGAFLTCPITFFSFETGPLVVFAVTTGMLAAVLVLSLPAANLDASELVRYATRHAVIGAAAGTYLMGLISLLGSAGPVVALLFALSSPVAIKRLYTWQLQRLLNARAAQMPADGCRQIIPPTTSVTELSTAELVHAWRASFSWLTQAQTTTSVNGIVAQRQQYLDELERRDPDGLRYWLESGARAASDPSKYLREDGGGSASNHP